MKSSKVILGAAAVLALGLTACNRLNTDTKKASYAIGQQIGSNLKQQSIEIDPDAMTLALKDAAAGKNQLTKEEMQAAMQKLQELAAKKQQEAAAKNASDAKGFMEKNKSTANLQSTASGLQYVTLTEGTGGSPTKDDVVKVHYKGTLTNGEQFDSSYDRGTPAEFPVSGVIPGWTEALQLMKVGGKAKLFIPPELAYGPAGRPGIPPNSVLVFEVELLEIVKKGPAGTTVVPSAAKAPKAGKRK